jgi:acetyl esterase/lipase
MSAILLRSVLAPLKLCPDAFCKVQVLLSPSLTPSSSSSSKATAAINGNGDAHHNDSISSFVPSPPFIPSTYLPEIIQQCSSLWGPSATYTPSPHLPTGHAQTIYSAGADTVMQDVVHYKRRVILVPDGGIITLDVAEKKQDEAADKETIVILHGLTGGSQESYVRHCVKKLLDGPGYRCIVVNFRGCESNHSI